MGVAMMTFGKAFARIAPEDRPRGSPQRIAPVDADPSPSPQANESPAVDDETKAGPFIQSRLADSDLEFVRVVEDVITALIEKRILLLTDLPPAAQQKISQRINLRSRLSSADSLLGDSEEVMLP